MSTFGFLTPEPLPSSISNARMSLMISALFGSYYFSEVEGMSVLDEPVA
jgi:hypothetical protein